MVEYTRASEKAELIAEIERSRARLGQSLDGLRRDADISSQFKSSFSTHKAAWLSGAGIAGWILSRLPARKKKAKVFVDKKEEGTTLKNVAETGMLFGILKLIFTLFRPAIMAFATKKITEISTRHAHSER
ncbi:MAG: hypothetical protein WCD79_22630 [Chthoniobacteraceae bacterium]